MTTYVMRGGKIVDKSSAPPRGQRVGNVISDTMGTALRHPITGKVMDSKSRFREVTRAHGCVEVGNDVQRDRRTLDLPPLKQDIARAISELGG